MLKKQCTQCETAFEENAARVYNVINFCSVMTVSLIYFVYVADILSHLYVRKRSKCLVSDGSQQITLFYY